MMEKRGQLPSCENCLDYVSGACTEEEKLDFESHLPHCEACQEELEELRLVWEALPTDIECIEPPADLKKQVMNAALNAQAEDSILTPPPARRSTRGRRLTSALLTAAMAGIVLLSIWNIRLQHEQAASPLPVEQALHVSAAQIKQLVSLKATGSLTGKSSGVACIVNNGQSSQFVVYLFGAAVTSDNQAYQVWLIKDGIRTSAGTFRVGAADRGIGLLAMPIASASLAFDSIGITLEPDDRGDQPRGEKVYGSI